MIRGEIDWELDAEIEKTGGFSTTLTWKDRNLLRSIVRKIHLMHYPPHTITTRVLDGVIDAIGPETAAYLIRHNMEGRNDG